MARLGTALTILAGCAALMRAAEGPSFEVATVKPVSAEERARQPIGLFTYPGGRIRATNYTLRMLIHDAYSLEMHQIVGGPPWADTERFAVEAKPPAESPSSHWIPENSKTPPNAEMRRMLQSLLVERFGLRVHRESKTESVYALVVAKGGPKLDPPKDKTVQPFVSFGRTGPITAEAISETFIGQNATIDQLVIRLSQHLGRPVLNQTGVEGNFDFRIEYAATDAQSAAAPPLVRAIQEQTGLKLQTQPGSIELLVIDQAKKPSGN
jgi:uncharacterized protein (TIGR03435 family)